MEGLFKVHIISWTSFTNIIHDSEQWKHILLYFARLGCLYYYCKIYSIHADIKIAWRLHVLGYNGDIPRPETLMLMFAPNWCSSQIEYSGRQYDIRVYGTRYSPPMLRISVIWESWAGATLLNGCSIWKVYWFFSSPFCFVKERERLLPIMAGTMAALMCEPVFNTASGRHKGNFVLECCDSSHISAWAVQVLSGYRTVLYILL